MDSSVATGLFALGGVLVGGVVNYTATARQASRARRRQLRISVRLVAEELDRNRQVIETALNNGRWNALSRAPLHRDAWSEHRGVVADLPYDVWHAVRHAERLVAMVDRVHRNDLLERPISPSDVGPLTNAHLEAARVAALIDDRYGRSWWERRRTKPRSVTDVLTPPTPTQGAG